MVTATILDAEEQRYIDIIKNSNDATEIGQAKSKLNSISVIKWDSVSNLGDLSAEIDSRLLAYKSSSDNMGVYKSTYQKWKEILNKGVDEDSYVAARDLLVQSDRIIYSNIAKERIAYLKGEAEKDALIGEIILDETGQATLSGGTVTTLKQDENGVFVLTTNKDTVTVKEGAVLGGRVDISKLTPDSSMLDRRPVWTDTNTEYHRYKTEQGFVVDSAYIKRYYSIIDAEVYFGNEYVEDVHDINWVIQQNTLPLFGYNSYTYDEIARGNRIISGNFTINFTSPNYLFSILAAANKDKVTPITNMASYSVPKLGDKVEPTFRTSAYGERERGKHANIWPETFDIDIIFGEKTGAGDPVHIILLGCALQGCQMALSASAVGTPPNIMENYSFIAQDIRTVVLQATGVLSSDIKDPTATDNEESDDITVDETTPVVVNEDGTATISDTGNTANKAQADTNAKNRTEKKAAVEDTGKIHNVDEDGKVIPPNTEGSGYTSIKFKQVSDPDTCELLARFNKIFAGINNRLTSKEQKELYQRIQVCMKKNEYYKDLDDNNKEIYTFAYTVTYNGEVKRCVTKIHEDILFKLSIGTYYDGESLKEEAAAGYPELYK